MVKPIGSSSNTLLSCSVWSSAQFLERIALLLCVVFSFVLLRDLHLWTQSVRDSSSICLLFDASLLPRAFIVYPAVYNSDLISQVTVANLIDYSTASLLPPQWAQLVLTSAPPVIHQPGFCTWLLPTLTPFIVNKV